MYLLPPEYFRYLEERLQRLEKENEELKRRIAEIKPIHIENINYKIQELVVQELSGTLNIGLSGEMDENLLKRVLEEDQNLGEQINLHDLEASQQKKDEADGMEPEG
jgi:hypothetical protein